MNKNILQKILTELEKEVPSIEYLKGMVETLIELGEPVRAGAPINKEQNVTKQVEEILRSDEEDIPAFLKPGPKG